MRKQTKLVAVLSTAALLALGASMSSFAATGWQEENGTWVYYDKSGDLVTEDWKPSGDNWFYLNEDGEMATDVIVEDNDNYYYVDENGAMAANKWVAVENEDYDGDDDEQPVNNWYYFGVNGKAYKSSSNSTNASFKTINGKKYIFDDEGRMLYGWINENGERETGDDAWEKDNGLYYCGDENDGAQASNEWRYLDIVDTNYKDEATGYSSTNLFDDEDQTRWFFFKANGKKMAKEKGKTIDKAKYSFDEHGRMNAEWVNWKTTPSSADDLGTTSVATYSQGFRYYGNPEDGARVTKGWFKVVPDSYLNEGDFDNGDDNWYWADKNGELTTSKLETINGKKYAFDEYGAMQTGLKFLKLDSDKKTILSIVKDDTSETPSDPVVEAGNYKFDTTDGFKAHASSWEHSGYKLYLFSKTSGSEEGSMKTGKQALDIDGDSHNFLFNKSGSYKGAGKTGLDDKKYYQSGMLMKADKEDKYAVAKVDLTGTTISHVTLLTTDEFIESLHVASDVTDHDDVSEYYDLTTLAADKSDTQYRLINTSGSVQKNKKKAKDGNDRCYDVANDGTIKAIFVED